MPPSPRQYTSSPEIASLIMLCMQSHQSPVKPIKISGPVWAFTGVLPEFIKAERGIRDCEGGGQGQRVRLGGQGQRGRLD